jgi:hypothetical protein
VRGTITTAMEHWLPKAIADAYVVSDAVAKG